MSENSKIEWTHHTFNPWWGCAKISPGCDHCYAERDAARFMPGKTIWGVDAERRQFGDKHWNEPLKWNKKAKSAGERHRVFCASMADVFDKNAPKGARDRLWSLIKNTPNLDWLILTKRIGNAPKMLPADWADGYPNIWLGVSIVNQEEADRDIPKLLRVPAAIRFLSMEPLLGLVDLTHLNADKEVDELNCLKAWAWEEEVDVWRNTTENWMDELLGWYNLSSLPTGPVHNVVDWVIAGGESGPQARPMHPDWVRSLRDQCSAAGAPFLFKQWGEWAPGECAENSQSKTELTAMLWDETPPTWKFSKLTPRQSEETHHADAPDLYRLGKKAAGRLLDGRTWDEYPRHANA